MRKTSKKNKASSTAELSSPLDRSVKLHVECSRCRVQTSNAVDAECKGSTERTSSTGFAPRFADGLYLCSAAHRPVSSAVSSAAVGAAVPKEQAVQSSRGDSDAVSDAEHLDGPRAVLSQTCSLNAAQTKSTVFQSKAG